MLNTRVKREKFEDNPQTKNSNIQDALKTADRIEKIEKKGKVQEEIQVETQVEEKVVKRNPIAGGLRRNWDAYSLPSYLQKEEETQISMEIKESPKENYYKIKRKVTKLERLVEVMPFWQNFLNMFTLVFAIFTITILSILLVGNFNELKNEIPLFYNQVTQTSDSVDKSIFITIPIGVFFFNMIILRLSMMIYNFDKKLVVSVNLSLILFNLLIIIGVLQIMSLVI